MGRVIFSELTAGSERDNLSYGLSTYLTDNEHDLVVVDTEKQTVAIQPPEKPPIATFSFAEFAKKNLVAAHLVDEPMTCPSTDPANEAVKGGPVAGVDAPRAEHASRTPLGSHLPYMLAGAVAGAIVVGAVRSARTR